MAVKLSGPQLKALATLKLHNITVFRWGGKLMSKLPSGVFEASLSKLVQFELADKASVRGGFRYKINAAGHEFLEKRHAS